MYQLSEAEEGDGLIPCDWHSQGNNCTPFFYGSSGFAGIDTMVTFKALL